jgi:FOG: CBS domain
MISSHLIDRDIIPLKTSDTGKEALSIMEDYNIFHLPIVNNEQYLGLITEEDIIQFPIEEAIGSYRLGLSKSYILESDHLFDALSIMGNYELSIVPVIDLKNNYVGVVTETTVIGHFSKSGAFTEKGSLIVLEMKRLDYSLAELTRLIEGENAQILSAFISSPRDANV